VIKINLIYPTSDNYKQELDLIEQLCKFEKIECTRVYPDTELYKQYYKGIYPVVLIHDKVLYGFWRFAHYLYTNLLNRN